MKTPQLRLLRDQVYRTALSECALADLELTELEELIEQVLLRFSGSELLSIEEKLAVVSGIVSKVKGYGVLDTLLADERITEIMVNGPGLIFAEREGHVFRTDLSFESEQQLEDIIQRIVGKAGREVNQANPIVDTRLSDGSRVHVVLPPVSLDGPLLTIRKFSASPLRMEHLIAYGSITAEAANYLQQMVLYKYNIFISGGTGAGKTTLLNALSYYIPPNERIITIEDSAELQIRGCENLVRLEVRNANSSGSGLITMRDLIKATLRMRPERIIIGEVRGAEAMDMLQAMNTGHDGSISTGHANSTRDMLYRLETMVLMAESGLTSEAIRRHMISALDVIVHISRLPDHSRKVVEISEVSKRSLNEVVLNPLFIWQDDRLVATENLREADKYRTRGGL